jgi:hypothetical protein
MRDPKFDENGAVSLASGNVDPSGANTRAAYRPVFLHAVNRKAARRGSPSVNGTVE